MSLKYTLAQVRDREVAAIGTQNLPNGWWPLPAGNDCLAFQLERLGVRSRQDLEPHFISIAAFRSWAGWHEVAVSELQQGDLAVWNFSGGKTAEHIEYVYSVDRPAGTITTVSANTGPQPGIPVPRGVWKKTRPISGSLLGGIRPPYAGEPVTSPYGAKPPVDLTKAQWKVVARYLNDPANVRPGSKRSSAEQDGVPGEILWGLIQEWGRDHGLYGDIYKIDRIPGPRTRQVAAIIYARAKTSHKAT